jgi:hypothetical protein
MGMAQVMPGTLRAIEQRLGRTLDPFNPDDALVIHREVMKENLSKFGNLPDALRAYDAGWNKGNWNNSETNGYVSNVMHKTPLPDGDPNGRHDRDLSSRVNVGISGEVTLPVTRGGAAVGEANLRATPLPSPSGASAAW